jgi:hypothetical protein
MTESPHSPTPAPAEPRTPRDVAHEVLVALASAIPTGRAAQCTTHHGCDCYQWANERLLALRDAARSVLPSDDWTVKR